MIDIATALAQSRQHVLSSLFPLFSSASRPCPRQPKHSGKLLANTTLTIGPHSFPRTKLFLLAFDPNPDPDSPELSPTLSPPPRPRPALPPKPFSAWLIGRVNELAGRDTSLQTIVRRAAAGEATKEEVGRLAKVIDQLKAEERARAVGSASASVPASASTSKTHATRGHNAQPEPTSEPVSRVPLYAAVLIEFADAAGERYLLPSHYSFAPVAGAGRPQSDAQAATVTLECFVCPGQAGTSVLDEQRSFMSGKGKGRGLDGQAELVPVTIEVAACSAKAREALFGASRTSRKLGRDGDNAWTEYVSIQFSYHAREGAVSDCRSFPGGFDPQLAAASVGSASSQPIVVPRSPSPSPELEEPRWRLSNFAKIEWVYDDDPVPDQAKKKPPKRTALPAPAGGPAKKLKLAKAGTPSDTHTPASSHAGAADTPEPGMSGRDGSSTPVDGSGVEGAVPVKKKKNNKTTGQYAGMGRGWRAAAAAAAAAERAAAEAGGK